MLQIKILQQPRDEQAIVLRKIFTKFEQDLCDKLRQSMEPVLLALQQLLVMHQQDDVFMEEVEGGDLLKEFHGDPIFDVYDDIDPNFDDCVGADPASDVVDEENDINIIGIQAVNYNNLGSTTHVHVIEKFGMNGEDTHLDTSGFLANRNHMDYNKPPDRDVEIFFKGPHQQVKSKPPDVRDIQIFGEPPDRDKILFFHNEVDFYKEICGSPNYHVLGDIDREKLRACEEEICITLCGYSNFVSYDEVEPPDRHGNRFLGVLRQNRTKSEDIHGSYMKIQKGAHNYMCGSAIEFLNCAFGQGDPRRILSSRRFEVYDGDAYLVDPIQWCLKNEAFNTKKKHMSDLCVASKRILMLLSRELMWKYYMTRNSMCLFLHMSEALSQETCEGRKELDLKLPPPLLTLVSLHMQREIVNTCSSDSLLLHYWSIFHREYLTRTGVLQLLKVIVSLLQSCTWIAHFVCGMEEVIDACPKEFQPKFDILDCSDLLQRDVLSFNNQYERFLKRHVELCFQVEFIATSRQVGLSFWHVHALLLCPFGMRLMMRSFHCMCINGFSFPGLLRHHCHLPLGTWCVLFLRGPWFLRHVRKQLTGVVLIFAVNSHYQQRFKLFIGESLFVVREKHKITAKWDFFMSMVLISKDTNKVKLVQVHITTCCVSFSQHLWSQRGFLLTCILQGRENLTFFWSMWAYKRFASPGPMVTTVQLVFHPSLLLLNEFPFGIFGKRRGVVCIRHLRFLIKVIVSIQWEVSLFYVYENNGEENFDNHTSSAKGHLVLIHIHFTLLLQEEPWLMTNIFVILMLLRHGTWDVVESFGIILVDADVLEAQILHHKQRLFLFNINSLCLSGHKCEWGIVRSVFLHCMASLVDLSKIVINLTLISGCGGFMIFHHEFSTSRRSTLSTILLPIPVYGGTFKWGIRIIRRIQLASPHTSMIFVSWMEDTNESSKQFCIVSASVRGLQLRYGNFSSIPACTILIAVFQSVSSTECFRSHQVRHSEITNRALENMLRYRMSDNILSWYATFTEFVHLHVSQRNLGFRVCHVVCDLVEYYQLVHHQDKKNVETIIIQYKTQSAIQCHGVCFELRDLLWFVTRDHVSSVENVKCFSIHRHHNDVFCIQEAAFHTKSDKWKYSGV